MNASSKEDCQSKLKVTMMRTFGILMKPSVSGQHSDKGLGQMKMECIGGEKSQHRVPLLSMVWKNRNLVLS